MQTHLLWSWGFSPQTYIRENTYCVCVLEIWNHDTAPREAKSHFILFTFPSARDLSGVLSIRGIVAWLVSWASPTLWPQVTCGNLSGRAKGTRDPLVCLPRWSSGARPRAGVFAHRIWVQLVAPEAHFSFQNGWTTGAAAEHRDSLLLLLLLLLLLRVALPVWRI